MPKSMLIVSFLFTATVFLAGRPAWFISADKIGSVNTGRGEGAAEIVAYAAANQSLYIVNAADNSLDIVSITDAHRPDVAGVRRIDLAPYGAAPTAWPWRGTSSPSRWRRMPLMNLVALSYLVSRATSSVRSKRGTSRHACIHPG